MGGKSAQQPSFIQAPPPQITQAPPPNIQQNADDLFAAQVKWNPQLTAQATQLQQQYGPQLAQSQVDTQIAQAPRLAQSEFNLQSQYGPMYRALFEQMFPSQTQGLETLAQQALQRLQSPQGLTPEQQSAQDAIRQRAYQESERGIRSSANLGGTLYGGQRQLREDRARNELAQGFATQDIGLADQRRAQTLQELIASGQVIFPQVQQPGVPAGQAAQFGQGVTPNPDALLQAMLQGQIIQQPIYQQGAPGTPSILGSFGRGYSGQGY